jgi:CBS domain-containing protein
LTLDCTNNSLTPTADILAFLVEKLDLQDKRNWNLMEDWMAQLQFQGSCLHAIQKSRRNPWYVIQASETVHRAMEVMAEFNIHRLAVSDMNNNFVSILTQSRLVNWLADTVDKAGKLAAMSLEDFKFGYREVLCVADSSFAVEAFLKIYEAGVSGIAVVNDAKEIVGSISVSDLKDIGTPPLLF